MTFNFTVSENSSLLEEVAPDEYSVYLDLSLDSVIEGENEYYPMANESLRKFLRENLYDQSTTKMEYLLRGILFGRRMSQSDIDKGIKKIKNKWKKTRKVGEYSVDIE